MKRMISLMLSLLLIFSLLPARAEGAMVSVSLPDEIDQFFSASRFAGYAIGPNAYVEMENTIGGSFAFAVASKGSQNVLYGFEKKNGVWSYWLKTDSALPQGEGSFQLHNMRGGYLYPNEEQISQDALMIGFVLPQNEEYNAHECIFQVNASGQWHLIELHSYLIDGVTTALVADDHISYYSETSLIGTAYGVVETNLRYFSLAAFPGTLKAAREKLSNPPVLPAGSELTATNVKFTSGQKFEVYSGPGEGYERAANGRAIVSTNDWIQVFGQENGYILIQYSLSSSQMRFGYITQTALPGNARAASLALDDDDAVILQNTFVTDDPLNSQTRVRSLSAGQSGVKWLAVMGNWVYVEISGVSPLRGFVPAAAISRMPGRKSYSAAYNSGVYTASATVDVTYHTSLTAAITVYGPAAWLDGGADAITGYQLYANNVPVSALSSAQRLDASGVFAYTFTLSAALPAGATVAGLCPIYASGQKADETLILKLDP